MPVVADTLTDAQSADLAAMPTKRQVTAKRASLIERDGHLDFNGERCSPCADCGLIFTEPGLRLRCGEHPRMLCRRCLALAKKSAPRG